MTPIIRQGQPRSELAAAQASTASNPVTPSGTRPRDRLGWPSTPASAAPSAAPTLTRIMARTSASLAFSGSRAWM